jgi:uncharacterized delta-60 repeat protein
VLVLVGLTVLVIGPARAAPGALDPSFGRGGAVTTAFGARSGISAVVLQPNSKIIAAGSSDDEITLARYNANGSLDRSFGSGGKVTTPIGSSSSASAVALRADGKIIAAGSSDGKFALVRYKPDGSLDSSFGTGGTVTTSFGPGFAGASSLALAPDGRIVAAGRSLSAFALARYEPDGSLDTGFGVGGKVTTTFDPTPYEVWLGEIALQPDGKIVAAGTSSRTFALARYETNGSLDPGFGNGGKVKTVLGPNRDIASAVALQPDGKIVAAGYSDRGSPFGNGFALARYNPDGSLDSLFGSATLPGTTVTATHGGAEAVVLQPDGRILAGGSIWAGSDDWDFALVRYKPNGALDKGFGRRGVAEVSFGPGFDWAYDLALQPNGRVVAAGMTSPPGSYDGDFALARFLGGNAACEVPRVTGRNLAVAKQSIAKARCSVGTVTMRFSRTVTKRHVISQRPTPGARRPIGTKVDLVISKGAKKN